VLKEKKQTLSQEEVRLRNLESYGVDADKEQRWTVDNTRSGSIVNWAVSILDRK